MAVRWYNISRYPSLTNKSWWAIKELLQYIWGLRNLAQEYNLSFKVHWIGSFLFTDFRNRSPGVVHTVFFCTIHTRETGVWLDK
jgi:hypothetical protein